MASDADDDGQDNESQQPQVQPRTGRCSAAQVLDLALLRMIAYAGLRPAPGQVLRCLLAGERAVLGVGELLRIGRHFEQDVLATLSVDHQQDHVRRVDRLNDVLEMVAACYTRVRVIVYRVGFRDAAQ